MSSVTKVALGVLTSVGGFLEAGSVGTALEAGASFHFSLLWPIALGAICIAFLTEMSGRLAAISHHTLVDAMRKRFGFPVQAWSFGAQLVLNLCVLAAEIGGAAYAVHLATGWPLPVCAPPIALLVWTVLWLAKFGQIEHGVALLGLVTLAFVVAAVVLGPDWRGVARGLLPTTHVPDRAHYAYLAVSLLGASISPYLITFYSSGAIEEKWKTADLLPNRLTSAIGMGFGSLIAMAVLVVAGVVLYPAHVDVRTFGDAAGVMTPAFGPAGYWLFVAALFIGCAGAAFELTLDTGYLVAQTFGWDWSENHRAWTQTRFSLAYTLAIAVSLLPSLAGVDPFALTMFSMSLTALALPLVIGPMIVVMNDRRYLKTHTNGVVANVAVTAITAVAFVLAAIALPLQIVGG